MPIRRSQLGAFCEGDSKMEIVTINTNTAGFVRRCRIGYREQGERRGLNERYAANARSLPLVQMLRDYQPQVRNPAGAE